MIAQLPGRSSGLPTKLFSPLPARCSCRLRTLIENKEAQKQVRTNDCRWVEPHMAEVLAIDLVEGNIDQLFKEPNSIAMI